MLQLGCHVHGLAHLQPNLLADHVCRLLLLLATAGYHSIAKHFFADAGFEHVALLTADGALEASPAMGCADIILDLVSTGE